jgi:Apea-like HEPN
VADRSPSSKWNLLIPFITAPEFPLKEASAITFGGLQAELRPGAFGYSSLLIEDIDSEQAAYGLFSSLRIGLLAASLKVGCGVRVRDEVEILSQDSPMPDGVGVPIIYPKGKDLSRLLIGRASVQQQVEKVLPTIVSSLAFGMASTSAGQAMADDRVKLALELYVDSYFEISNSARFLGFVNVLEVLKDKGDASDIARGLIDRWSQEASKELDTKEAASIRGSLRYLRFISISRGIGSTVERHLGQDRAKEAQELYQARSNLVHNGIRPDDFPYSLTRAQKLVTDLLAHIFLSGSLGVQT